MKVYRVVEYDPHRPVSEYTWSVQERTAVVLKKEIRLTDAPFTGLDRHRFDHSALGTAFFASEATAILAFMQGKIDALSTFKRQLVDAERALTWAREESSRITMADGQKR